MEPELGRAWERGPSGCRLLCFSPSAAPAAWLCGGPGALSGGARPFSRDPAGAQRLSTGLCVPLLGLVGDLRSL